MRKVVVAALVLVAAALIVAAGAYAGNGNGNGGGKGNGGPPPSAADAFPAGSTTPIPAQVVPAPAPSTGAQPAGAESATSGCWQAYVGGGVQTSTGTYAITATPYWCGNGWTVTLARSNCSPLVSGWYRIANKYLYVASGGVGYFEIDYACDVTFDWGPLGLTWSTNTQREVWGLNAYGDAWYYGPF